MPLVDASDSVLVVVDVQPGFTDHALMTDDDRAIASEVVDRIAWLAGFAGLLDVPVVAVEETPDENGATDARVAERLPAGTPVETKDAFSLAACQPAVDAIRATERRTLVVTGFETDVCVAQTAVQLADLGYRVVVPSDTAYTTSAAEHRHGIERMAGAGVEPSNFKGLIFEWMRTLDRLEQYREAERRFGRAPLRSEVQAT